MSGTRFARAGRWRLFLCIGALILMLGMIALFHNQQELDEKREQRLRALNEQLQSIIEQKYQLERNHENERLEQIQTRHNLEQKLKGIEELETKEQLRYEKLQQTFKQLQIKHNELEVECGKSKKDNLEYTNQMEKKLQAVRTELQNTKNAHMHELNLWRDKYNAAMNEDERLEGLMDVADAKEYLRERIAKLESVITTCKAQCGTKSKEDNLHEQIKKPPQLPIEPPLIVKSFNEQVAVSPGLYKIVVKETNNNNYTQTVSNTNIVKSTLTPLSNSTNGGGHNLGISGAKALSLQILPQPTIGSLILNSVENFQILPKVIKKLTEETETQLKQQPVDASAVAGNKMVSPLSAPRKPTSTEASKSEQHVLEPNMASLLKKATNSSSTSSSLAPLPLPPNQRKLPDNVAPIPEHFEELLKHEATAHKKGKERQQKKSDGGDTDAADIDAAVEDMRKNENENDDANNNRYANVVNEMEVQAHKAQKAAAANEDSGAHEIKDHDFVNEQNFNLPAAADEDGNFFDGVGKNDAADADANIGQHNNNNNNKDEDNEDDDMLGVGGADTGDIAVKSHDHLLDAEVAADQGKEFPADGLRLDDGNEEDEDEDDYSNLAARHQGAQAIRN